MFVNLDASLDSILFVVIFLGATFAAAVVAGLAGFAFGLVAAAVWLYILSPLQTATLIIWFGLVVQGYAVWKLRHALSWTTITPLVLGAALGVPLGVFVLSSADPRGLKIGVGVVLMLYSLYSLLRPTMKPITAGGRTADAAAGFLNGALGGATGLAGIVATIWCQLRGWPKDRQRTVFQPVAVATFAMSALWLGGQGTMSSDLIVLFAIGLPVLLFGHWAGLQLYGRLDEARFRKIVLVLLLLSGAALLFR
jgi:uncharacterized membrane protein YfcA